MKKLFIFFIFLQHFILYSQDYIKPIAFDDIIPIWQHVVIDSSRLNDTIYMGTKHLSNLNKNIFIGDSIAYFVYVDKSEDAQGAYLEKIDLKSGKLLWSNAFNINNSGKREYPTFVYINDSGNLEIVCFRNIQDSFIFFWNLAQLSIREYNSISGQLMKHIFQDQPLLDDEKLIFYPSKTLIYPNNDNEYIYYSPLTTENDYLYQLIRFDNDAKFISIDTVSKKRKYCCFTSQPIIKIGKDSILTGRHQNKQSLIEPIKKENYDTFDFSVDLYSSSFDSLVSYDLIEYIPYYWNLSIGYDKAGYISVISKDSIKTNNTYMAISYFNMDGTHYETLDFEKDIPLNLKIKKLPNQEGFLLIDRIGDNNLNNKRKIEIKKSDGHGNIELIKTISFEGGRYFAIKSMDILKNNMIILGLQLRKPDPTNQRNSLTRTEYIIALDGNKLGLVDTNEETVEKERFFIYPNPVKENITIEFSSIFSGNVEIIDILGRNVRTLRVDNSIKQEVDATGLTKGIYNVMIEQEKRAIFVKRIVVQ